MKQLKKLSSKKLKTKKVSLSQVMEKQSLLIKGNIALLRLILAGIFLTVIAGSGFIYYTLAMRKTPPVYVFNGSEVSSVIKMSRPKVGNEAVIRWASQAVSDLYTFNFMNIDQHFKRIKDKFTDIGYSQFSDAIGTLKSNATSKNLIYAANSCDVVEISNTDKVQRGTEYNTLWLLKMPILIKITSANDIRIKRYLISVIVEGGGSVIANRSIGITSIRMDELGEGVCTVERRY